MKLGQREKVKAGFIDFFDIGLDARFCYGKTSFSSERNNKLEIQNQFYEIISRKVQRSQLARLDLAAVILFPRKYSYEFKLVAK